MATAPSLTRSDKAIGIVDRQECIPLDNDTWKVRDTATGSGRWHIATVTSCDCYDAQRGNICKHICAVQQEAHALTAYAVSWDYWASTYLPTCPDCGAVIEQRQYWVGGVGWLWFKVCTHDSRHYGERA